MRFIASLVALFLFFSTVEAGYWLAGRWFVSSRSASVSLQTVKSWLDRGIVSRNTEWAKIFVQRQGKWVLLTLALSQVISEVERLSQTASLCYVPLQEGTLRAGFSIDHQFGVRDANFEIPRSYYTSSVRGNRCVNNAYIPAYPLYRYRYDRQRWINYGRVPAEGTFTVGQEIDTGRPCQVTISLNMPRCSFTVSQPLPSVVNAPAPSGVDFNQRRRVPVRVFPNVNDFLRPDVIANDPALSWLRNEYERLSRDASIPTIPADLLGDLELPGVDWSISPDEALDFPSERGSTRENEGSREAEGDVSFPGLDTGLEVPAKRSFPFQLVNSLVESHPLVRVIRSVSLDVGGGGSCVFGSEPFRFDFCPYSWVFNLMGGLITFIAFLTGLLWVGRSD